MRILDGMRIAILCANDGVEEVELTRPRAALGGAGAAVTVVCPEAGPVATYHYLCRAGQTQADTSLEAADPSSFDALVVPGGLGNPDKLRTVRAAVDFARAFFEAAKPVGVICHGPWVLIETGELRGRSLTSVPSLATDIGNAGGTYIDAAVHVDKTARNVLISSRNHETVDAFVKALLEELPAA